MKELEKVVANAFGNIVASGAIEQAIQKKLEETITSAIDSHLREYSDFGKQIKEKVGKAMQVNFAELDLPSYNKFVLEIVTRKVEASMDASLVAKIEKDLAEMMLPVAPEQITLEQLIADFIKHETEEDGSNAGEKITLILEESRHGFRYIHLDKKSRGEKHFCDYKIGIHADDGRVFTMSIGGRDPKKDIFVGKFYAFERTLFQMYVAGTKLIIEPDASEHDFELHFPYND